MITHLRTNVRLCCLLPILLIGIISNIALAQSRAKYRSIDGSNNNLSNPQWGAANIPLFRELAAEYADGLNAMAGANRPNPRQISNQLSNEKEDIHNRRGMAGLFYAWGQFIDHDMTNTTSGTEKMPIPLPSGESKFTLPISFSRSKSFLGTGISSAREQINESNSWLDASMVYGNSKATADWLRTFNKGKMWTSNGNLLPYNTTNRQKNGILDPTAPKMDDDRGRSNITFAAGDRRSAENTGLTSFHTLFVREHNRICDRLLSQGYANDETIYQIAKREVAALIQSITYGQWLSSLGVELKPYTGYDPSVRSDIANTFVTAAYRWHTMVENDIILRDNECRGVGPVEIPLKDAFFNINIVEKYDIGVILKGLSVHRSYETDVKVNSGLRNFLFGTIGTDLVSINIQRGRDHGLPNYNAVRQYYTGTRASSFADITNDGYLAGEMEKLYGNIDNVDLWVGLYAESHLEGKSIGRTVDAMVRRQFENLRDGDFYFYQNDPELVLERSSIRTTTLADVISRNSSAGNFQSNVFFVKSCESRFDDLAKPLCSKTTQYDGWTLLGRTSDKTLYRWNGPNTTYSDARGIAERIGGSLLKINSLAENDYIKTFIPNNNAWLDMGRNAANQWQFSGVFDAADAFAGGGIPTYFNWRFGEPNNVGKIENYVAMGNDGKWNDVSETAQNMIIAEVRCDESPIIDACLTASYYNNKTLSGNPALVRKESSIDFDWKLGSPAIGINIDNFSARYEGYITAPTTGTYTFEVVADDGIRLWINNSLLIDKWSNWVGTTSATIYLTKGANFPIKLEYNEAGGPGEIRLKWKVPQEYNAKPAFTNLKGSYFRNTTLSGSPVVRAESSINYDWGWSAPMGGFGFDYFSVRYEGNLTAPVAGDYAFAIKADDGIRMWVNNKLLVDQWNGLGAINQNVRIFLDAGVTVPIKVEYKETWAAARCQVDCTAPTYGAISSAIKFSGCPIDPTLVSFSDDECYAISARHNGKTIGVNSTSDGVPVQQNIWTNNSNQIWKIKKQDDSYYKVENFGNNNKVFEVEALSTAENARVVQRGWYAGNNQKWNVNRNLGGYYTFKAKHSDKALSVPTGYELAQSTFNNSFNQQWVVAVVGCPSYANRRSIAYDITARREGSNATIHWISNLEDVVYFELERMDSNTQKFEVIEKIENDYNGTEVKSYTTLDKSPVIGKNAYRIIAYTSNGAKVETAVEVLNFTNLDVVNIYPNPAEDVLNIDLSKFAKIPATIYIYDSFGRVVRSEKVDSQTESVSLDVSDFTSGRYLVRVAAAGQEGITKQVIILHQ